MNSFLFFSLYDDVVCNLPSMFDVGKMKVLLGCTLAAILAFAVAFPQKEGNVYTNEAIRQAQSTFLIPKDAEIQKVRDS